MKLNIYRFPKITAEDDDDERNCEELKTFIEVRLSCHLSSIKSSLVEKKQKKETKKKNEA